jgi:hypothetical protein
MFLAQLHALLARKGISATMAAQFAADVEMDKRRPLHQAHKVACRVVRALSRMRTRITFALHAPSVHSVVAPLVSARIVQLARTLTRMARASVHRVLLARIQPPAQARVANAALGNTRTPTRVRALIVQQAATAQPLDLPNARVALLARTPLCLAPATRTPVCRVTLERTRVHPELLLLQHASLVTLVTTLRLLELRVRWLVNCVQKEPKLPQPVTPHAPHAAPELAAWTTAPAASPAVLAKSQ